MLRPLHIATVCAALLASSIAWADPVAPGQATAVQREQANARFLRGKQLFSDKSYDAALAEFRASADIVASPNARLYIARCYREQGKLVEAYAEFGRTAAEAREHVTEDPRYAKTAESANAERDALAPQLGFVNVAVTGADDSTKLKVGGDEIRRAGWSEAIPVRPGQTDIVVESAGRKPLRQSLALNAGEKKDLSFDVSSAPAEDAAGSPAPSLTVETPKATDRTKLRPWAYVAGGVGAAGLLTFTIAGLMSNGTYNDLKSACGNAPCPANKQSDVSAGRTQQTIANVGLVFGVLGIATGVTLFVLSMPPKNGSGSGATTATVKVGPQWAGLEGTFR